MFAEIKITHIIEWIITLSLGIIGWYVAIRSTLSQQKKERYNDLVHDFHVFIFNFRYVFLQDLIKGSNNKYNVQNINSQVKYIYYKAKDLDTFIKNKNNRIYEKIKNEGEVFTDSTLLDPGIENALISNKKNKHIDVQKKNFLMFADIFFEKCYSLSKFNQ